ncbi:PREDICTED: VQ motif-containing protein 10-like [Nelumbo nucifera]|uniref:VQ domain-containing protein n=2 Tax=Nelumbo nucifera TaxID=4432 RepID=A0A822YZ94_NELNU|nr:PREDICTED: VQ motif-containing protein 10-like [Nelumbo nucifera]DAD37563.1 TPA_asm: hypothetical protein HUJ06_008204 [Nelumbo nucifera]DAD37564.1 TPA_asm: hypothetical protein HUJ06_008205 [Nelumbo nucifera]
MSGEGKKPVLVKFINTQYVQIDAMNFKSVVQSLTGKDATIRVAGADGSFVGRNVNRQESIEDGVGTAGGSRSPRDLAMELDRLLKGLPPMDDLHLMWAE